MGQNQHWVDNADTYICPICRFETSSPAKYPGCKCPMCGFQDEKDANQNKNNCPFCHEDREGFTSMVGAFYISNPFHRGEYYIHCGHAKPRKINFCPICGRELKE